jgi:hypothetical protein
MEGAVIEMIGIQHTQHPMKARLLVLLCGVLWTAPVRADAPAKPVALLPSSVTLAATGGISQHELAALALMTISNIGMVAIREDLNARLDRPQIPANFFGDWDVRASAEIYAGAGALHGGFADYLGNAVMPAAFLLFYTSNAVAAWASGRSWTDRLTRGHSPPELLHRHPADLPLLDQARSTYRGARY